MKDIIKNLAKRPFFKAKEAKKLGFSQRMLSYYTANGELNKIARGLYCCSKYQTNDKNLQWEDLAVAVSNIKGAVICLVSALVYYNLTDELMKEFWIAVDNTRSKVNFPLCRIVRMRNISKGVETIYLSGFKVKIFNKERTIIDSFKLLDFETAMKALKIYLTDKKEKPDINKLNKYAKELRASKVQEYITAIVG